MKFLAVLQIVCIVLLSSFSGAIKPAVPAMKTDCCQKVSKNQSCHHTKKENKQQDNCNNEGCNMMLLCGICGFLKTEPLAIKPALFTSIEKPVLIYKVGNLADYSASDWKPPKV